MGGFYSIHNKSGKDLKYTKVSWIGRKRNLQKITSEYLPFYNDMKLRITRRGDGRTNDIRVYDLDGKLLFALSNADNDTFIDEQLNILELESFPWWIIILIVSVCVILFGIWVYNSKEKTKDNLGKF